ncbi:MAG: hypothetical protein R2708_21445 [Vicinamibacterales bacterium]
MTASGRARRWTRLLAALLVWSPLASAYAQPAALGPPVETWRPYGRLETLSIDGTTLYAGGAFDYVGPDTGGFGIVEASDPAAINTAANLTNGASAITPDGNGGWFVLTSTAPFSSTPAIAHILPTGQRDTTWVSPDLAGTVDLLEAHGGRLFVGGFLTAVNGVPRAGIAALDAATGALLPWDARLERLGVAGPVFVQTVEFTTDRIYVGGSFDTAAGQPRGSFAVLDEATAAVLPLVLPASPSPGFVDASISAGRVYVSAFFGGGQPTIRAYDLDLVPLPGWDTTALGSTLSATPTAVYAERWLSPATSVMALDPSTGSPLPFATVNLAREVSYDTAWVTSMAVGDGRLYIGGEFQRVNGQVRRSLVAVDAVTGAPAAWGPRVSSMVNAVATSGGRVAVGGGFQSIGGIAQQNLVTIDLTTGRPTTPLPPNMPFVVKTVLRLGEVVVVGGERAYFTSPEPPNLVAYARSTGALLPWSLSADSTVAALASDGRELFIGGGFTSLSGQVRPYLASVDLQTAAVTSWNPGIDGGGVGRLVVTGNTLYALGYFGRVGTEPRFQLAAFDTPSRALLPFSPAPGQFADMALYQDRLLLSGAFFPPGASPSAFRWVDRVSGADVAPVTDERGLGRALSAAGGTIYASVYRTVLPAEVVAIDAESGHSVSLGPGPPNPAPIAASDDYLAYWDSSTSTNGLFVYRTPRAGAPRAITANVTGSTATLGWQTGPPPATTSFVVEAGTTPGGVEVGAFPVGLATQASGALSSGTYHVRVRSVGANGPGAASSDAIVTLPAPAAPPGVPGALSGSTSGGVVSLSWGAAAGNATTYVVEAGTAPGLANLVVFPTGNLDTTLATRAPSGTYYVRVRAANAFGVSPPTNEIVVVVP